MDIQSNYKLPFEAISGNCLLLTSDLTIIAVSDGYAATLKMDSKDIKGRNLLNFLECRIENYSKSTQNKFRFSLENVLKHKKIYTIPTQKYHLICSGGGVEQCYWRLVNKPVFDDSNKVIYIAHWLEDLTETAVLNEKMEKYRTTNNDVKNRDTKEGKNGYSFHQNENSIRDKIENEVSKRFVDLVQIEKRYHSIIDNMTEGMQIIDRSYRYVYVNNAVVKQSRYAREELIGYTMMERYPGIEKTELFAILSDCMQDKSVQNLENEFNFPDGTVGYFALSIQPIPEGVFILSSDITQRKITELELESKNEKLQNQNRELEQFSYIASHDLQEPLRTVYSFSNLLEQEAGNKLNEDEKQYLRFIMESSRRMTSLVKGLLDYSRIGKTKDRSLVDVNNVVSDALADLSLLIDESDASISVGRLPTISAFPTEIRQLFQNLISNALKFKKEKGKLNINIYSEKLPDQGWRFAVADNGIGIDEKHKEKIFIIFKRLHNRSEYPGTGIGLSQCKKVVELHGGEIWVESRLGEGSTFFFTIV